MLSSASAPSTPTRDWGFNLTPADTGEVFTPVEPKAGEPCQECLEAKRLQNDTVRIRASLFFDGTLNNKENSENRDSSFAVEGSSYLNDVSNIGILFDCGLNGKGPGADFHISLYVEGIGTITGAKDSTLSAALGVYIAGVLQKVEKGIKEAASDVGKLVGENKLVWVHVDTFGFSRGAAAARNCVHQAVAKGLLKKLLTQQGHPPSEVLCKFVGLFDTVASFGVAHWNDTWELSLDCLGIASKVVQLAAAEEHRANFRLTDIASAGGKGEEHFLPGVHSDIGGGYVDGAAENILVSEMGLMRPLGRTMVTDPVAVAAFDREATWLTSRGWYKSDQLVEDRARARGRLRASRAEVSSLYSRIPLQLMGEFARQHGVPIGGDLQREHNIPADDPILAQADAAVRQAVSAKTDASPSAWFKDDASSDAAWHKELRGRYLHFSAQYGTTLNAHGPQRRALGAGFGRYRVIQRG